MTVVGLGTQDSLGEAQGFVARHGISFRMLWDSTFESWRRLEIPTQPAAILLSPGGAQLRRWIGSFDEEEAVRLASES
jgi:hypothetical protein